MHLDKNLKLIRPKVMNNEEKEASFIIKALIGIGGLKRNEKF